MTQYCVHRIKGGRLVLDLQTDVLGLSTKVVAPLVPMRAGLTPITVLEPVIECEGSQFAVHTAEMAAVPSGVLGEVVVDVSEREEEFRDAVDLVFSGF